MSPRTGRSKSSCTLASEPAARRYDLVLDSYCLQSIVTDEDRRAVFAAVRARLNPTGYSPTAPPTSTAVPTCLTEDTSPPTPSTPN